MLLMALSGVLAALLAYMIKPVLDQIFIDRSGRMLIFLPLGVVAIAALKGAADYSQGVLLAGVEERVLLRLREALYSHTLRLPLTAHLQSERGATLSRMSLDLTLLQQGLSVLAHFFLSLFTILGLMGVVLYQSWELALISFIALPLAFYPLIRFGESLRGKGKTQQEQMGGILDHFSQSLDGIEVIKVQGAEGFETRRFGAHARGYFETMMRIWRIQKATVPLMEFIGALGIAVIIWLGGWQVVDGQMTTGAFFSFLTALIMLYEPLRQLSSANNQLQQGLSAAERLFAWLDTLPEQVDGGSPTEPWRGWRCRDLSLRFPGETALENLTLELPAGKTVAIVGPSGGGKTSLVRVLLGLVPPSTGEIRLGGQPIDALPLGSYRRHFAFVGQDPVLFTGTALSNIAYGDPAPDLERARRAAVLAHAWEFLVESGGLDTPIVGDGANLSGGQRQRLAIARALYLDRPVLVLDEATSNLDRESEERIAETLSALHGQKSIVIVAHRPRTVELADLVIHLERGRLTQVEEHPAKTSALRA